MYKYAVRFREWQGWENADGEVESYVYFVAFSSMSPTFNEETGRSNFTPIVRRDAPSPSALMDVTSAKMVRDLLGGHCDVVAVNEKGEVIG